MKKHLLLILALLAFVLPARAATELLFNFTQNSNGSDQGTSFSNNANVTAVISNVSYGDTDNVTDYVSSLTNVSNAYYNSKGGLHLGPNGTVTVNLKKTYKVVKYEVMGPTPTQHSIVNTSATVAVNGHTYTGVNAAGSANWNRVQYEPTATENVNSFTIKAGNTDVYVKSIHIYLEAESDFTAPKFVPNGGRVKKGQTITVVNCEPSRLPQMDVTYGSNNERDHIGDFTFTFDETGTFACWATAHSSSNWSAYSETTEVSFEVYEDATPEKCATPVFTPATGTFGPGKAITVTCSTPGATINVSDGENFDISLTSGQSFNLPTAKGEYYYIAVANATGYEASEIAEASYTVQWPTCEKPVFNPDGGTVAPGTVVTLTCATAGAEITYYPADNEDDFNLVQSGHTFTLPTTPGTYTYKAFADASATFYGQSEIVTATYTVTAPVRNEVAPVITFSHEDQKVFGSEEEIDVTLSLNSDVYPVPDVIYYTLDGFMAHNTIKTGEQGATPAGHVLTVDVDPATLSGTVRIERSHREALNHRAVTINAYAVNTAGSDVAAATYIFNDNAAPLPDPEPTTITATVTMANQGWTSGQSPYTADNSFTATWTSDKIVDLDNATISFATVATSEGSSYPAFNSKKSPQGLRFYSTSTNNNTITINVPDDSYRFVSVTFTGTNSLKVQGTTYTSGTKVDLTDKPSSIVLQSAVTSTMAVSKIEFVLEKTAASAAPAVKANAANNTDDFDTFNNGKSSTTYGTFNSTDGWKTTQCQLFNNKTSGVKIKRNDTNLTPCTKKSTTTAKISSPKLTGGIGTLKFTYGLPYSDTQINFKVQIQDAEGKVIKEESVTETGKTGGYTQTISKEFNIAGDFVIVFATPTSVSSRQAFYDVSWTNYGGTPTPTVEAPVISLSEHANTTEPVTVTIDCATEGATVTYTVKKDGTTVADNLPYDAANKPVYSAVGSYTVDATATLGTASANATQVSFEITEPEKPSVATPEITLSTQAKPSDPVTVTIDCATEGATVTYTVKKDGTTVADNLPYDPANKPVFSEVGSYTVNATASKEGMNPANATPANFTIEKLVEVVEELFFVMDQNLWDVDGAYPETVVPFVYDRENGWYDLDIASIPATGWRQTAEGWFEINGGFRGNFYVRDGKANHKGLVFGAAGTVANTTYATRAAADGNQLVEPGVEYNMYIAGEGETHKVFTTIGDETNSKAFSAGTIRVTHTPGNKDAAKPMTLQILANSDQTTGVDSITAEDAANDADARFFNLQGVEVPADRLAPGIYIRQAGSKATKVLVK